MVTDFCHLEGHLFLIYADRFSGWVEVDRLSTNNFRLVRHAFLKWFQTYGVPEEIASDGGPPFNSLAYKTFLRIWDVRRRLSSAYYPQSNGRAEAAVKSVKRILQGNINPSTGDLDTDAAARAIMTHRNTPAQDTGIAPSVMLFGKPLRDHLPRARTLRREWSSIADSREDALARRVSMTKPQTGKELRPLNVGDSVQVQNQTGHHPNKWNSTGVVSGVLPNRQYNVVMDGSRRVTLRNRRFLKEILPVCRRDFGDDDLPPVPEVGSQQPPIVGAPIDVPSVPVDPEGDVPIVADTPEAEIGREPFVPAVEAVERRRGTRLRAPRIPFQARMEGKYHE